MLSSKKDGKSNTESFMYLRPIFSTNPAASKNAARFKSDQNRLENNHLRLSTKISMQNVGEIKL